MLLGELGFGRHLVADIGWVAARRERAIAAGVTELPAPPGNIDDGVVLLPAITVVADDGSRRMFRLPLPYLTAIRRLFAGDDAQDDWTPSRAQSRLPCHFVVGDRETVCLLPDGDRQGRSRVN
jgi:hypothetical protein